MVDVAGWRLLGGATSASGGAGDPHTADGATNMAIDRALLESVRDGAPPVLRFYRWDPPTLSFGRNQPARGLYDRDLARERGIAFVRRPTGGQAVLHADEVTYAVVAPVAVIGTPRAAYGTINRALVAGLRALGVPAHLAGTGGDRGAASPGGGRTRPHARAGTGSWSAACFREPAAGELVVRGRKLVGSAQRCERGVVLQHGSILVSGSQAPAEELLVRAVAAAVVAGVGAGPAASSAPGWTTLEAELGGPPGRDALVAALATGFSDTLGTALAPGALSVEETTRVEALRARFASSDWTWRR
ncbi:MAG TPA: lipoate--protein ligase family protein [Longimicrobiales bacterium]|nr:lipoate--protein ligase family protein [Longimicrobiales bacterium]